MRTKNKKKTASCQKCRVAIMLNSLNYDYADVFILKEDDEISLILSRRDRKIDRKINYNTIQGAKNAVSRLFKDKAIIKGVKPHWSHLYDADPGWLKKEFHL